MFLRYSWCWIWADNSRMPKGHQGKVLLLYARRSLCKTKWSTWDGSCRRRVPTYARQGWRHSSGSFTQERDRVEIVAWNGEFSGTVSSAFVHDAPPTKRTAGGTPWDWTDACEKSFNAVKEAISSDKLLTHYDPSKRVELSTDASPYDIGAVICHNDDEGRRLPIAYASRSLNNHERGYAQLDKEALAIMFGVQRFRTYLYGRKFLIRTDHKPLERILGPKTAIPSCTGCSETTTMGNHAVRLWLWVKIHHREGQRGGRRFVTPSIAWEIDSWRRCSAQHSNPSPEQFACHEWWSEEMYTHRSDAVTSAWLDQDRNWPKDVDEQLKPFQHRRHELTVEQDCILWGYRVVIPKKLQEEVLLELHTSHPGIVCMKEIARSHVWWFNIDIDIGGLVKQFVTCQQTRNVPTVAPLMPWVWPISPWSRIHIDFAQKDRQDFLVIVDAHSKWPEIIMMNSTTTSATIRVLRDLFSNQTKLWVTTGHSSVVRSSGTSSRWTVWSRCSRTLPCCKQRGSRADGPVIQTFTECQQKH